MIGRTAFPFLLAAMGINCIVGCSARKAIPRPPATYRPGGVVPEHGALLPYRWVEAGDILDAHADPELPRRFGTLVSTLTTPEGRDALRMLYDDGPVPRTFHRVLETRRALTASVDLTGWFSPRQLATLRRVEVDGIVTQARYIRDIPLVEEILNVPTQVSEPYEALRTAVKLDSERLAFSGGIARDARLWLCVRVECGQQLTYTFYGRAEGGAFKDPTPQNVGDAMSRWFGAHEVAADVREISVLPGEDALRILINGRMCARIELVPLVSTSDGTIRVVSNGDVQVGSVYYQEGAHWPAGRTTTPSSNAAR